MELLLYASGEMEWIIYNDYRINQIVNNCSVTLVSATG